MDISRYDEYLVVTNNKNKYTNAVCTGDKLHSVLSEITCYVGKINTYEIYTNNPETGESGWDIKHINSTDKLIRYYPNFDCVITKNDSAGKECKTFLDFQAYLRS